VQEDIRAAAAGAATRALPQRHEGAVTNWIDEEGRAAYRPAEEA